MQADHEWPELLGGYELQLVEEERDAAALRLGRGPKREPQVDELLAKRFPRDSSGPSV